MKASQFATLCFTCLLNIVPIEASAQPYVISPDGLEVTDQKTGLIWRRCAEGMQVIDGTCTGTALTFTHDAALQRAADQVSPTAIWRLPNIKELTSIADKSLSNPAIDATAFPATPASYFWSSSPYAFDVFGETYVWGVYFLIGYVYHVPRTGTNYVRLVRAAL